jgi:hypothetical protein
VLGIRRGGARALYPFDLGLLAPVVEGLWHTANLWGNRFNGRPQRWIVGWVLLQHANGALVDLVGELR